MNMSNDVKKNEMKWNSYDLPYGNNVPKINKFGDPFMHY